MKIRHPEGSNPNIHPGYFIVPYMSSLYREISENRITNFLSYEAAVAECEKRIEDGVSDRYDIYKIYHEGYVQVY